MKFLKTIGPWVLTILLFVFLFSRIPIGQVVETLANAQWGFYLAILFPYSCAYLLLDTAAVTVAVRQFHAPVRYREMIPVRAVTYVLSLVNHNVAQGGLALWLWRKNQIPFLAIAGTMIFLAFIEVSDLILFSSIGAIAAGTSGAVPGLSQAYIFLYCVLAGILFYFRGLKLLGVKRPAPGLLSTFDRARLVDYLAVLLFKATALFLAVVLNWAAVKFFGMDIPFYVMLAALPLIYLASAVPLTVAKLGTAQAAWVFLLGSYAPEANLLAYSLCAHLMFLVMNALLGVCFLPAKGREIWELAARREEFLAEAASKNDASPGERSAGD